MEIRKRVLNSYHYKTVLLQIKSLVIVLTGKLQVIVVCINPLNPKIKI